MYLSVDLHLGMESQRVGHDWATEQQMSVIIHTFSKSKEDVYHFLFSISLIRFMCCFFLIYLTNQQKGADWWAELLCWIFWDLVSNMVDSGIPTSTNLGHQQSVWEFNSILILPRESIRFYRLNVQSYKTSPTA